MKKKIQIFKEKEECYDAVVSINEKDTKAICQELVQQMVNQSVDNIEKKDNEIYNLEKQLLKRLNIQNFEEEKENYQPNQWKSQSKTQFQQKTFFFNNDNFQKNNKYKQQIINHQYPPGIFKSVQLNGQQQPMILEESKERYQGKLKFFDEQKNYGFIIMDNDKSDIFVHFDDLSKGNISKEFLKTTKNGNEIHFSYKILSYIGKYDKSRKAIDLELITN